jgi:hypothetical protein
MNDERIDELINKSIDGVISESEKAELDGYIKTAPELNKKYEQMVKTAEILNELPNYEVSPNIKKNIMNAVENTNHGTVMNSIQKDKKSFFSFNSPKTVLAFALGVAVCVCVFLLWNNFNNSSVKQDAVSGFMGKTEMEALPFDTREIYFAELLGIESSLRIFKSKDTLYISMNKKTTDDISIGYSFDPACVSFVEVRESISTSPVVKSQNGTVSVTVTEPTRIFAVFQIVKPSSEMDIQVRDAERQVFRYKFNTDKEKIRI